MSESLTTTGYERLSTIIEEKFDVPRDTLTPDTVLETLSVDSLALIELLLLLQKRFGVVIPTDEVTPGNTVGELADRLDAADEKA